MKITFADLFAEQPDLKQGLPLNSWLWLIGAEASPLLVTAFGDAFFARGDGQVCFLDTYEGRVHEIAPEGGGWEAALRAPEHIEPTLLAELRGRGLFVSPGQCYSPVHPLILGGKMEADNFEITSWRVHIGLMGQIYEQSKDLPEGTPIRGVTSSNE